MKLFKISIILILMLLLTCTVVKQQTKYYYPLIKKQHTIYKQPFYFIQGIDDTCDTNKYDCIDMRSYKYQQRMHKSK